MESFGNAIYLVNWYQNRLISLINEDGSNLIHDAKLEVLQGDGSNLVYDAKLEVLQGIV
jgi:hypothetical protein